MSKHKRFSIKTVLRRSIKLLDKRMNELLKNPPSGKENITTKDKFFQPEGYSDEFPLTKDSYYNYSTFVKNKKSSKNIKSIDLSRFYDICTYTDVCPEYLLGMINTKRKEESANKVREEFGLSDKAMDRLVQANKNQGGCRGELTSSLINFILENDEFWEKLAEHLTLYLSYVDGYRVSYRDLDVERYGLVRTFEELIDDIADSFQITELPVD